MTSTTKRIVNAWKAWKKLAMKSTSSASVASRGPRKCGTGPGMNGRAGPQWTSLGKGVAQRGRQSGVKIMTSAKWSMTTWTSVGNVLTMASNHFQYHSLAQNLTGMAGSQSPATPTSKLLSKRSWAGRMSERSWQKIKGLDKRPKALTKNLKILTKDIHILAKDIHILTKDLNQTMEKMRNVLNNFPLPGLDKRQNCKGVGLPWQKAITTSRIQCFTLYRFCLDTAQKG